MKKNINVAVGLDIGTTKIAAIVGHRDENGKLVIIGMGRSESLGVQRGVVSNIQLTIDAIKEAIKEAEKAASAEIAIVNVGIAGQHIKSVQHSGLRTRDSMEDEITQEDIDLIIKDMYKLAVPSGEQIIDVIPQEFTVDYETGVRDPIGMSGIRLQANCHLITGQITAIKNIYRCVQRAGLEIQDLTLEPLASADAVLAPEEKEAGVALVDIGGGTTDIAIFHDNILRHTAVIPFGGDVITRDIREGCSIIQKQAEQLKLKFGSALASENNENEIVSIPGLKGRIPKEISVKNLSHIIQARMEEIIDHIIYELRSSGYEKKLIAGIVLTGGGSQLQHIKQLVELQTGLDARIGYPNEHIGASNSDDIKKPMYATGVGLVLKGLDKLESNQIQDYTVNADTYLQSTPAPNSTDKSKEGFFSKVLGYFKEEEEDKDL